MNFVFWESQNFHSLATTTCHALFYPSINSYTRIFCSLPLTDTYSNQTLAGALAEAIQSHGMHNHCCIWLVPSLLLWEKCKTWGMMGRRKEWRSRFQPVSKMAEGVMASFRWDSRCWKRTLYAALWSQNLLCSSSFPWSPVSYFFKTDDWGEAAVECSYLCVRVCELMYLIISLIRCIHVTSQCAFWCYINYCQCTLQPPLQPLFVYPSPIFPLPTSPMEV